MGQRRDGVSGGDTRAQKNILGAEKTLVGWRRYQGGQETLGKQRRNWWDGGVFGEVEKKLVGHGEALGEQQLIQSSWYCDVSWPMLIVNGGVKTFHSN